MKFGEDLMAQLTPEWRKQYLVYDDMKILLYQAQALQKRQRHLAEAEAQFFNTAADELKKVELFFNEKLADALRKLHDLQRELDLFELVTNEKLKRSPAEPKNTTTEIVDKPKPRLREAFAPLGKSTARLAEKQQHAKTLSQIKFAFSEYYLSVTLLNNFTVMNKTGFRKIMKKHDKLLNNTKGKQWYNEKVLMSKIATDRDTARLLAQVERIVTERLEGGDRQTAMKKLRVPPLSERQGACTTFRLGVGVGLLVALVACTMLLYATAQPANNSRPQPRWVAVRLFRGPFVLFVNIWLLGLNVYGWQRAGVNHVLIFEIDPRNHLTYQSLMQMASMLCVTWSLCVLAFVYAPSIHPRIPPFLFPLILMLVCILWTLNPIRKPGARLGQSSRWWFLDKVFRCFTAPFHRVTFADFWLADQMNSLTVVFLDMHYFVCFYTTEFDWNHASPDFLRPIERHNTTAGGGIDFATGNSACHSAVFSIRPLVKLIPPTIRFLQCVRRHHDTGKAHPHLVNAGKYATAYFVVVLGVTNSWFRASQGGVDNLWSPLFYIWVLSYVVSYAYTFIWDVWMDWSLMEPKSRHPLLRDELIYGPACFYYACIANDFVLRLSWALNVALGDALFEHKDVIVSLIALVECWRRFIWNLLRLENEHLNNCGQFRAVRDISLKPIKKDDLQRIQQRLLRDDGGPQRLVASKEKLGSASTAMSERPHEPNTCESQDSVTESSRTQSNVDVTQRHDVLPARMRPPDHTAHDLET